MSSPPSPDLTPGNPSPGWPAFWQSLRREVITGAWPEIHGPTHPIFRVSQTKRRAWRNLIDTSTMQIPWVVVETRDNAAAPGWGAGNVVYRPMVSVYYIAEGASVPDIAAVLEEKLATLERTLQAQNYRGFQYWPGETEYDVTDENAVNSVFLASNLPLFGGSLTFRAHFGYIAAAAVQPRWQPLITGEHP